jgi:phospholipid-binding lipoprotein MlaA
MLITKFGLISLILLTTGCASVNGPADPRDPLESYNRSVYKFNESFDNNVAKPVAGFYNDTVPAPVNKGITNFFSNLDDVIVLANDLFQLKFPQAAQDLSRIFFNTTIGLYGFIDVATFLDLPKHNEDFGQTLGYWGIPSGPYFVLPFLGPSTIRDSVGLGTDYAYFDPTFNMIDDSSTSWSLAGLHFIDRRSDLLGMSNLLGMAALDPYVFTREAYLQRRLSLVYDGNPPAENFDDFGDDEPENQIKAE